SQEDADATPPGGDDAVQHGGARRQLEHPGIEDGRQKARELPVWDTTGRLYLAPAPDEPRAVTHEPGPAAHLLARPTLPQRDEHQTRLDRQQDRREQEQQSRRERRQDEDEPVDRKSTRLNSSHGSISYAVFCLKKKKNKIA